MTQRDRLLTTFLDLARIPSPSGREEAVAETIAQRLAALGLDAARDAAGNLLARVSGEGRPLLLTAHMDTVTPCEGVTPVVQEGVVRSDGRTVLGADNKAGVAVILEALAVLHATQETHCPLEVLFTVREESGLEGAKAFDVGRLQARQGVGLDAGGPPGTSVVQAPSQDSWQAVIHGRMAHAGVNPEAGINAIRVAAEAVTGMPLGRIDEETTANVGVISGGRATNIIPDEVTLRGEARSRDPRKLEIQTAAMSAALQRATEAHGAGLDLHCHRAYEAYHLDADAAVVRRVSAAMASLGIEPLLMPTGGGSDANVFNAAGIETVQLGVGMRRVHTCEEEIAVDDMAVVADLMLAVIRRA